MAGVYKILNIKKTNEFYIGSTINNIQTRFNKHIRDLTNNKHCNIYLQRLWNKHGNIFKVETLIECKKEECLKYEQFYIDKLNPKYNICKIAGNTYGFKQSKEFREHRRKLMLTNNPFKGKTHSKETKEVLSNLTKGKWSGKRNPKYKKGYLIEGKKNPFYGKKHTDEYKRNQSELMKGKYSLDKHPNFGGRYLFYHEIYGHEKLGQCELVKKYNLSGAHVCNICKNKKHSHKGWKCIRKLK